MEAWHDIFKEGEHNNKNWLEKDLNSILANFKKNISSKASKYLIPLVRGHPKTDDPAYGWVDDLQIIKENGIAILQAKYKDITNEFKELVNSKKFPNRSVKLRQNQDKTWDLVHIGYLGAVEPAVDLKTSELANKELEYIEIVFENNGEILFMKDKPEATIEQPDLQAKIDELEAQVKLFNEDVKIKEAIEENNKLKAQNAAQSAVIAEFQKQAKVANISKIVASWNDKINNNEEHKSQLIEFMSSFNEANLNKFVEIFNKIIPTKVVKTEVKDVDLEQPIINDNDLAQFSTTESNPLLDLIKSKKGAY